MTPNGSYDVAVVGGGVAGMVTGLLLARGGRRVCVLEARTVGSSTTGLSTGKVSLLQGSRLSRAPQSVETLRKYVEGNREGQAWLRRFCDDHGVAYQVGDAWTYATTEPGEAALRSEQQAALGAGLDVTWETTSELPFPIRAALRLPDQFQIDPRELVDALAAAFTAEGGEIRDHSRVLGIRERDGVRHLATADDGVTAHVVVLATNQPILRRHAMFAKLRPERSYAALFDSPWAPEGMHLSIDPVTRSLRSVLGENGSRLLMVGGSGHVTGRVASEQAHLDDLLGWTEQAVPGASLRSWWSAQDQASVSGLPYVGPMLPGEDSVLVTTGFAKWGFTNAVAAALLLSKRIHLPSGELPDWADAFASWSAPGVGGTVRALGFNAGVAGHLVGDAVQHPTRVGTCTHLGGVVRWNDAEHTWDCPLHGSRFAADGSVLEAPAVCGMRRVPAEPNA